MFDPAIVQVAESVSTAIGYQVSPNSMIVGAHGVIMVDPGPMPTAARKVRAEFDKITPLPVRAIVYTNGASAFHEPGRGIEVWARANFGSQMALVRREGLGGSLRPSHTPGQ